MSRRPHMTTPPPRLSRRTSTSPMPAARQSSSWRSIGYRPSTSGSSRRESRRPRASRSRARVPRAGARPGRTAPTPDVRAPPGTPNSSDATIPPGRTTRDELGERRAGVVDVAQEVREREVVEARVRERQRLGGRFDELDRGRRIALRARASICALWSTPVTRNPRRTSSAATRPVPVATSRTWPPSRGSRETRKRRQSGSCPNDSAAPTRSYDGPSGANSSLASTDGTPPIVGDMALSDELERAAELAAAQRRPATPSPAFSRPSPNRGGASTSARSTGPTERAPGSPSTRTGRS